jgi:hypothetical protein
MKNLFLLVGLLLSAIAPNFANACDAVAIDLAMSAPPTIDMRKVKFKRDRASVVARAPKQGGTTEYTVEVHGYNDLHITYVVILKNGTCRKVGLGRFVTD